jgi:hypothetical protein
MPAERYYMKLNYIACLVGFSLLVLTGCAGLQQVGDTLLTAGGAVRPDYAGTIEQIRRAIASPEASPVEGYEFSITYYYQGRIVPATDITWAEAFTRIGSADKAVPPVSKKPMPTASDADIAYRQRIENILKAAGLGDSDAIP